MSLTREKDFFCVVFFHIISYRFDDEGNPALGKLGDEPTISE